VCANIHTLPKGVHELGHPFPVTPRNTAGRKRSPDLLRQPDQPGRSTMDTLLRFMRDRQMLVVLEPAE
jgi:hypothetical protein